jgi:integrase
MAVFKKGKFYWFEFVSRGQRVRKTTRQGDRRVALQIEGAERSRLAQAAVGIERRQPAPRLKDFAQRFIDYIQARCAEKPNTVEFYASKLARLLKFPPLADASLDEIDESLVDCYVQFRRPHVEPATLNRELATLRRLLRLAQEWHVTDRVPRIHLLPGERQREFVLSHAEERIYLEFAPQPLRDVALLLLDTGLRPGEALALEWRDVHLDAASAVQLGYLSVREGKSRNARRTLSLTARVRAMLEARAAGRRSRWIFTDATATQPLSRYTLKDQHDRTRQALKLPREFVIYSLRHSFGTRLAQSGADAFVLMRVMGHSTVIVSQRYVHPSAEVIERAFERLEGFNQEARRALPSAGAKALEGQSVTPKIPLSLEDSQREPSM